MRTKRAAKLGALALLSLAAVHTQAQSIRPAYSFPALPSVQGPAFIQLSDTPFYFSPYVGLAVGHDDNVLLSSQNERSSTLYLLSPGFRFDARTSHTAFQARYQGQIGRYRSSSDDNYVDHDVAAQYDVAFDNRTFLRLGYAYLRSHDPRGATDRPFTTSPDEFRMSIPSVTFAYGAPGAQGRVELYFNDADRVYLNNRSTTTLSDRNTKEYGAVFYLRMAPKTYAMVEGRKTDLGYKNSNPVDGDEHRYYAGVMWEATAATTGTLKVGRLKRSFDAPGIPSESTASWEGIVSWAPRSYSVFDLRTSRQTTEATGLGNFILTAATTLNWTHGWSSVLNTGVMLRYQKDDYQGFDRSDKTTGLGLRVGYRFRRWLTLGAEYTHTHRNSTLDSFDYNKNLYLLTATGSL